MHHRFGAALTVLSVALSFAGPASAAAPMGTTVAQAQQKSTVSGTITDAQGKPIAGARVFANGAGTQASATTDNAGHFTISVPSGVYTLAVSKAGFETAQNSDVVVAPSSTVTANVALTETNLQSLQVIGRTGSAGGQRAPFNISESSVAVLPAHQIGLLQNNNLTSVVAELPGVYYLGSFTVTPNTSFAVHGLPLQTRTTIDGHPVSSGVAGEWNSNYAVSSIFSNVEVVKGAGLNGAIAGESAIGTVNLKTMDFSSHNTAGATVTGDQWSGGQYNAFVNMNFFNDKLGVILQKAYSGFNGPWNNQYLNRINSSLGFITPTYPIGTGTPPGSTVLDQWQGDFSNRYSLEGELAKLRWKFSEQTSVTFGFLGLQGQYQPQGGGYGAYYGNTTIAACYNGAVPQYSVATCTPTSTYSAPYTFGIAGQTVSGYTWFPNSFIQNNEPQFDAEFRTTLGNDTFLLRPYTHVINRYISGASENQYPGNGGSWYEVTNSLNCQVQSLAPGKPGVIGTGAAGPCFAANMTATSPAYVGANAAGLSTVFPTTNVNPGCSTAAPCYTNVTGIQNNGQYGYSTPFSQPELDKLFGYTFTYLHPFGNNVMTFSYDYRQDYTSSESGDTTAPAPGCYYVIGSVSGTGVYQANGTPYQPGCSSAQYATASPYVGFNHLPKSPVSVPPTVSEYGDFSLDFLLQLSPKLRMAFGNYYEFDKYAAQIENPATLNAYAALGSSGAAPVALIPGNTSYSHYDPHIAFQYQLDPSFSLRVNGGSSITAPYASLISGFGSATAPNGANGEVYQLNIPNFQLKPETIVSYDAGGDKRLPDNTVISADYYNINIHNVFLSVTQNIPIPAAYAGVATNAVQTNYANGPSEKAFGFDLSIYKNPRVGFGYWESVSLNRTFYTNLPLSLYAANTSASNVNYNINYVQIFGVPFYKSYSQIFYNTPKGGTWEMGVDWEGQNNASYGPSYFLVDASVRQPLYKNRLFAQLSAQNLLNLNSGSGLGRALYYQGNVEPGVYLSGGTLHYAGPTSTSVATPLFAYPPGTIRFSLNYNL